MSNTYQQTQDLYITIKSRQETLFEGNAYSLTSNNELGFFDILPTHANFVTLIRDFAVVDQGMPSEKNIKLEKGILTVLQNKVKVYVGI